MSEDTIAVPTVRERRHEARESIILAAALLSGVEGLTVEEQLDHVNRAKRALNQAVSTVNETIELIQTRDNDAWMKAKADRKAAEEGMDDDDEEGLGNDDLPPLNLPEVS